MSQAEFDAIFNSKFVIEDGDRFVECHGYFVPYMYTRFDLERLYRERKALCAKLADGERVNHYGRFIELTIPPKERKLAMRLLQWIPIREAHLKTLALLKGAPIPTDNYKPK